MQIDNDFYAVDPQLRRQKVIVKLDPFQIDPTLQEVELWSLSGAYLGIGKKYQRQKGQHPPLPSTTTTTDFDPVYLKVLRVQFEQIQQQERERGIDYQFAGRHSPYSFPRFAAAAARLLGRTGGISCWNPADISKLQQFHAAHPQLHEGLLKQAVALAETKSISHVLFQLQSLLDPRKAK